ncbi:hypothetical protein ACFV2V_11915 [Streptomyces sp. NPDC059698]|uniref:hypothetical protein n=1 Tax=unclassified Streptomyces TaxID=2593676 RepID=UPI00093B317B|nr:hypothetical protein [Streptomyces sp. CB02366]OKJ40666.1 hypothetical protein AMK24_01885 [Streptomyces sp. CB02366]
MGLRFLGIDPDSPTDESPTIWLQEETGDLLIQSYRATEAEVESCKEVGSIPGHSTDVPDHETIVRLPAAMLDFLPARQEQDSGGKAARAASSA